MSNTAHFCIKKVLFLLSFSGVCLFAGPMAHAAHPPTSANQGAAISAEEMKKRATNDHHAEKIKEQHESNTKKTSISGASEKETKDVI